MFNFPEKFSKVPINENLIHTVMEGYKAIFESDATSSDMIFWHGGNLDGYNDIIAQKSGRYEYGPGLYATTHYDTARRYSKGSRKLYQITVERGNELNRSVIPLNSIISFINSFIMGKHKKEMIDAMNRYQVNGNVKAYLFLNNILNNKSIKPTYTKYLRQFLVDNGIDYEIVHNPFGWGESMIVIYNMKKIKSVKQFTAKDKIDTYDLPIIESNLLEEITAPMQDLKRYGELPLS